jgi:hypothetical protein
MADFRAAFDAGQDAATMAERARNEIDDVFVELSKAVSDATDGKIAIGRRHLTKAPSDLTQLIAAFGVRERYWAIVAWNPTAKDQEPRQISLWEQDPSGYPCKLQFGRDEYSCHDRESLERCLSLLLQNAVVGEKLRAVMLLPPAEEPTTPA